ncbi:MAG: 30S ribosomal protein THX [Salibacteraceae bacterium]|nr:30S ribosomal protein THX [Salibacteraceae bacterium]MDP4686835.1 30S ribosomal protein THX [Salibacteraceae bacterium]MDP4764674.1 30S ribosomal protein THX [Salibacteraceae bacterium]MDP4933176.1 30S ribosomal protein THX [Salibacteraceae bacterium]
MGRGDIKTSKGKRFASSYGKTRKRPTGVPNPSRMAALQAKSAPGVDESEESKPVAKKAPAKKPTAKKPVPKKTTAAKPAAKKAETKAEA